MASPLYRVDPFDATLVAGVAALLLTTAPLAGDLACRRASKADPTTLRRLE